MPEQSENFYITPNLNKNNYKLIYPLRQTK